MIQIHTEYSEHSKYAILFKWIYFKALDLDTIPEHNVDEVTSILCHFFSPSNDSISFSQ